MKIFMPLEHVLLSRHTNIKIKTKMSQNGFNCFFAYMPKISITRKNKKVGIIFKKGVAFLE